MGETLYHLVGKISGKNFVINMAARDFRELSEHYVLNGALAEPIPKKGPTVLRLTRAGIKALADKAYNIKPYQINETGHSIAWYEPHKLNRRSIIPHSIETLEQAQEEEQASIDDLIESASPFVVEHPGDVYLYEAEHPPELCSDYL